MWIDFPPGALGGAEILVLPVEGEVRGFAYPLDSESITIPVRLSRSEPLEIEALVYASSLRALGLDVPPPGGELRRAAAGQRSKPLPATGEAYRKRIAEGRAAEWERTSPDRLRARDFLLPDDVPPSETCDAFDEVSVGLDDVRGGALFAIPLDDESILVGFGAQQGFPARIYRVRTNGEANEVTVVPELPLFTSADRDRGGPPWFARGAGEIWVGSLVGPPDWIAVRQIGRVPSGENIAWMDVSTSTVDGSVLELFTLGPRGAFERFGGARWEKVADLPKDNDGFTASSVARVGPGEAFAVVESTKDVFRYADSRVTRMPIDDSSGTGLLEVAYIPGIGPVAGTNVGEVYRFDGARWTKMVGSPLAIPIRAIVPYRDGFLLGSAQFIDQYSSSVGFCEPIAVGGNHIEFIIDVEGVLFLAGSPSGAAFDRSSVTLLRARRPG